MQYIGRCHCGGIEAEFGTEKPLAPRACQCGFCRRHGARTVSDPEGSAVLTLAGDTVRYRFASRTTDYILCGRCGIYLGAVADVCERIYVTLNLNCFDGPRLDLAATPVSYEGESAAEKAERRRLRWTPAFLR